MTDSFECESQTILSQAWKIRTYLSHLWKIRANFSQMWQIRAKPLLLWRTRTNVSHLQYVRMTCDKLIKRVVVMLSYSRPLTSLRKMLRRHPVVLKETRNRADTKVNVTVELAFILSKCLTWKIGDCQATFYSFSNKCESNLKPDSQLYSINTFCPGARVIDILPFWWNANNLDSHSWSRRVSMIIGKFHSNPPSIFRDEMR